MSAPYPTIKACKGVYEPAEDSFLLEDAVIEYASGRFLDMGTGSGIQGIAAAKKGCNVVFADINNRALECARNNAELNGVKGEFVKSDMFKNIKGLFNTIAFNPPYLASKGKPNEIALDGGKMGRELIDLFICEFRKHLYDGGIALLLESSINKYEHDAERQGASIIRRRKFFFEEIVVIKFVK
ncbi:MAG: methyltransferase [Candidatus Micrarchaeaceae archaeon]